MYRDALKGGPVSLINSQTGPGKNFTQPRVHLLVNPRIVAGGTRRLRSTAPPLDWAGCGGIEARRQGHRHRFCTIQRPKFDPAGRQKRESGWDTERLHVMLCRCAAV